MKKRFKILFITMFIFYSFALASCDFNALLNKLPFDLPWLEEEKIEYTIDFMVDDEYYYTIKIEQGSSINMPNDPYKEGYEFIRWVYSNGESFDISDIIDGDITLYAEFRKNEYKEEYVTINFYVDGKLEKTQEFVKDKFFENIFTPNKEGYIFIGWVDQYGNKYDSSTLIEDNVDLFAQFQQNEYKEEYVTVNYYVDGKLEKTQDFLKDKYLEDIYTPYKEGYTFLHWEDKNGYKYYPNITLLKESVDLYAVFTKNENIKDRIVVSFYVDDILEKTQEYDYNSVFKNVYNPYKSGHTFIGWADKYGNMYDDLKVLKEDLDLYAVFEKNEGVQFINVNYYVDGKLEKTQEIVLSASINKPYTPYKEGYIFKYWADKFGYEVELNLKLFKDIDLYAVFEKATLEYNGFSYEESPNHIEITNYTGGNTTIIIPDRINNKPVIKIDDNAFYNSNIEKITLPNELYEIGSRAFYMCLNLNIDYIPSSVRKIGNEAFCGVILNNLVLKNIDIAYDAFVGCNGNIYFEGDELSWLNKMINFDYNRVYFYSENQPNKEGNYWHYVDGKPVIWEKSSVLTCTLTYVVNDSVFSIKEFSAGEEVLIDLYPNLDGYFFEWWTDEKGNKYTLNQMYTFENNITLTASLYRYKYSINYVFEYDGVVNHNPISFNVGEFFMLEDATLTGYTFEGWYLDAEYTISYNQIGNDIRELTIYGKFEKEITIYNGFTYNEYTDYVEITGYVCNEKDLIIPDTINGKPVTTINAYTFFNVMGFETIYLPKSITLIKEYAFDGCGSLKEVYYEGTKEEWNQINIEKGNGSLTYAILHTSDIDFTYNEYENYIEITKYVGTDEVVEIPSEINGKPVQQIATKTFIYHLDIVGVEIPDSVLLLADNIFSYSETFEWIIIPNTIRNYSPISSGTKLDVIYYKGTYIDWENSNNAGPAGCAGSTIYYYSESEPTTEGNYWHYVDGKPEVWSEYVELSGMYLIKGYDLNFIPEYNFNKTKDGLYYLDIYLESNFQFMFYDYDNQKALYSHDIVAYEGIGFNTSTAYTKVSGNYRFEIRNGKVYISTTESDERKQFNYTEYDDHIAINSYKGTSTEVKIPEYINMKPVLYIGKSAFENSNIESLYLSKNIELLDYAAFKNCKSLSYISFNENLKTISIYAFSGCASLTNVNLPQSLEVIDEQAFTGCTGLNSIIIPNNVKLISPNAFGDGNIKLFFEVSNYLNIFNNPLYEYAYGYSEMKPTDNGKYWHYLFGTPTPWDINLVSLHLVEAYKTSGITYPFTKREDGVYYLEVYLDSGFEFLIHDFDNGTYIYAHNIVSKEGVNVYTSSAATNVSGLFIFEIRGEEIYITTENSNERKNYGYNEYEDHIEITACYLVNEYEIRIPSHINLKPVTVIGENAFKENKVCYLTIPNTVKEIKDYAFAYCDKLSYLYLSENLEIIGEYAFAFSSCISNVSLYGKVKEIHSCAFAGLTELKSLIIPNSVTYVDSNIVGAGTINLYFEHEDYSKVFDKPSYINAYNYRASKPTIEGDYWYYYNGYSPVVWNIYASGLYIVQNLVPECKEEYKLNLNSDGSYSIILYMYNGFSFSLYDVDNDILYYTSNIESYEGVYLGTGEIYTDRAGNFEIKVIDGKVYIDYLGA